MIFLSRFKPSTCLRCRFCFRVDLSASTASNFDNIFNSNNSFGNTRVLCTLCFVDGVNFFFLLHVVYLDSALLVLLNLFRVFYRKTYAIHPLAFESKIIIRSTVSSMPHRRSIGSTFSLCSIWSARVFLSCKHECTMEIIVSKVICFSITKKTINVW